jgi:hypothetical protein
MRVLDEFDTRTIEASREIILSVQIDQASMVWLEAIPSCTVYSNL